MQFISLTFLVSKLDIIIDFRDAHSKNMQIIFVTSLLLKFNKLILIKLWHSANKKSVLVKFELNIYSIV